MNWYLQTGLDSPIVMDSSVTIRRNIENFPFKLDSLEYEKEIEGTIKDNIYKIGDDLNYINLKQLDEINKNVLNEKGLISKVMLDDNTYKAILVSDNEDVVVEINSTDHLLIKVFSPSDELSRILNVANSVEQKLANIFKLSFSNKYGYLTQDLQNLGTGLNAKILLFLPGLTLTNTIKKIEKSVTNLGVAVHEFPNDFYQFTNMQTLGKTEDEIIDNLRRVVNTVVEEEKTARKELEKNPIMLEDKILRSYGILSNTKSITVNEVNDLLKDIRYGAKLGIVPELTDLKVNKIAMYSKPNMLKKLIQQDLAKDELNVKRAEVIKQILNNQI